MTLTVSQALKMGGLVHGRLLAGERSLGNVISGVDVIEIPFTPDLEWDSSNYLLLTSFYAIREDLDRQIATIELLTRWKTSALVFQQTVMDALPEPVVRRAEELGLPLIEIPESVPYSDVITSLMGAILEEKSYLLQRSEEIHRRLTDLCLSGGGLPAIAEALSGLVDCPVAILDAWFCLAASAGWQVSDPHALAWLKKRVQERARFNPQPAYSQEQGIWVMPLFSGEQHHSDGYILAADAAHSLDAVDLLAIEQASIIAALEMVKQRAVLETERRMQHDFVAYLFGEHSAGENEILSRAHAIGWDLQDKPIVALIDLAALLASPRVWNHPEADPFTAKEHLLGVIAEAIGEQDPQAVLVDDGDRVILLPCCEPSHEDGGPRRELQARLEAICTAIKTRLDNLQVSIAVGGFYPGLVDLKQSYEEAMLAMRVRGRLALTQSVVWYDDVALYVLLERIASQPEITPWFARTLGKLVAYDQANHSDLVRTLEAYFDANQTLQQAAFNLFVHPKTLKYRLQRIEEILGTDPFARDQQLKYYLATKLARLIDFSPRG